MDKVDALDGRYSFNRSEKKKQKEKKGPLGMRFSPLLELSSGGELSAEEPFEQRGQGLEQYLDAVHEEGQRLWAAPTLENIRRYKAAVRGFLKLVIRRMTALEERTSGVSVLKRKRFTQIRIVDEKLERLAAEVLKNQSRQLNLLDRVNEISGLLVDLLR